MRYCIVVTVIAGESGAALRQLLVGDAGTGNVGLKDYVLGRDADETGVFQRWVLAYDGAPVTFVNPKGNDEEIEVLGLIAYNSNISATLKQRIGELVTARPALLRELAINPPLTRAQMTTRIPSEIGSNLACSHYWHSKPGDDVTTGVTSGATLQAKFVPVEG